MPGPVRKTKVTIRREPAKASAVSVEGPEEATPVKPPVPAPTPKKAISGASPRPHRSKDKKPCPQCSLQIGAEAKTCHSCGWVWKPSPKKLSEKTPEELRQTGLREKASRDRYNKTVQKAVREIAGEEWTYHLSNINWERRLLCQHNLKRFNEVHLHNIFYLGWSEDQTRCIRKAETVILADGMFALAMPRGGGKTAIVRGALTWGSAYGHKRFPFNVGSTDPKSLQTLESVKTFWYSSPTLLEDFPEIAWPVRKTENKFHGTKGQLFYGDPTHIIWGSNSIRFPCLLLPKEDADTILKAWEASFDCIKSEDLRHDLAETPPLVYLPNYDRWIPRQAGLNMATAGIGGSIRGEAETHPITLEQPRPDIVILDDIQKDQAAESPSQVEKLINLIDGAVTGLAGPGRHISVFQPCTVTREGDVPDTYLDPQKKPEYRGERCKLVAEWPEGITDTQITLDTEPGKHWNKYGEVRRQAFRDFDRHSRLCDHCRDNLLKPCPEGVKLRDAATNYYRANREAMDHGFIVTWVERYGDPKLQLDGRIIRDDKELSAQQHAMNLRFKSPETFPAEYQQRGRKLTDEGEILITATQLAEKSIRVPHGNVPVDCQYIGAFLDVQNEILFYGVLGVAPDFSGLFCDYGTWPDVKTRYFTKGQTEGWSLLTRAFFDTYPEHRTKAYKTEGGKTRATLEPKIYHALSEAVPYLLDKVYTRLDEQQTSMRIQRIAIDTKWGQASDVIKRYIRESGIRELVPYQGQHFPPTNRQLEEYQRTGAYINWLFEDQKHPNLKQPKWVIRPNPDGVWYMQADVSRLKDFLFQRLAAPPGSPGSISLFDGTPDRHEMFVDHICRSEYPEPVTARGLTKNQWKERQGAFNNDFLDCAAGCCAIVSWLGACLRTGGETPVTRKKRKLSDHYNQKRR